MAVSSFHTNRPRPGRHFAPVAELALHEPALEVCASLPGARGGVTIVREMSGPFGMPDFTAVVGGMGRLDARRQLNVPPLLNRADAAIVSATTSSRGRSLEMISQELDWPIDIVERRVPSLVRVGALNLSAAGRVTRPKALTSGGRVFAVEAKLTDWRRALRQVRTYQVWADAYVLVMGELSASAREAVTEEVRTDRGGLFIAGRWVLRPHVVDHSPADRLWASEHVLAALGWNYQPSDLP